jgi:hypothetical protein
MTAVGNPTFRARVDKDFRDACLEKAERTGTDISTVLRDALSAWLNDDIVQEAVTALAPFYVKSEFRARTLLSMWARRKELTEEEFQRVLKEVTK